MALSVTFMSISIALLCTLVGAQRQWLMVTPFDDYTQQLADESHDNNQNHFFLGARRGEERFNTALLLSLSSLFSTTTSTSTVFSTSVVTTTCTKSTTACAGRRRREVILGDLIDKQADVEPSSVQPIEVTQSVDGVRETRDAQTSYPYVSLSGYGLQPSSDFHGVYGPAYHSTGNPANFLHFLDSLNGPQNVFRHYGQDAARFNSALISSLFSPTRRVTTTSTVFSISTITSTPGCSVRGTFAQCPASG